MEKSTLEPPETPAPLFALRAFKTALFGTPKEPQDEGVENVDGGVPLEDATRKEDQVQPENTRPLSNLLSPSKPQGILMTPGTTTTHRKTVSFGLAVKDNEGNPSVYTGKSGLPQNYPGKFPSPWTSKSADMESKGGQTALTKSLYEARDQSSKKLIALEDSIKTIDPSDLEHQHITIRSSPLKKRRQDDTRKRKTDSESDADTTLDLNEPRSASGRHWKSRYNRDRDRSKGEIRKLIKYKELARSYAKKKDVEKEELVELLREERHQIGCMEEEISRLAGEIARRQRSTNTSEENHIGLPKQLAQKTAETVEYKRNIDHSEEAIESENGQRSHKHRQGDAGFPGTHSIRKQSVDLAHMKLEMDELNKKVEDMTRVSQRLEKDKGRVVHTLSEVQEDLVRSEKRRQAQEARYKQREARLEEEKQQLDARLSSRHEHGQEEEDIRFEELQTQIKSLKAQLGQEKRAHNSFSKDHAEISRLKAQIKEQQDANSRASKDYKSQIARLTAEGTRAPTSKSTDPDIQQQQRRLAQELRRVTEASADLRLENDQLKQELHTAHRELQRSRNRGGAAEPERKGVLKSSRHRQPLMSSALSDLNTVSHEHDPQLVLKHHLPDLTAPDVGHGHSSPQKSSILDLPSPEAFSTSAFHGTRYNDSIKSQRLPTFNIASSPPQLILDSIPSKPAPVQSKTNTRASTSTGLCTHQVPPTRTQLPPDRIAAAKARLEQRNAEKRKLAPAVEGPQKENSRI
jgi:hypothetical protein